MKLTILSLMSLVSLAACTSNCGATLTPTQTTEVQVSVDAAVCILNHVTDPPATIAQECLGDPTLVAAVNKVLDAHKAAETRGQ